MSAHLSPGALAAFTPDDDSGNYGLDEGIDASEGSSYNSSQMYSDKDNSSATSKTTSAKRIQNELSRKESQKVLRLRLMVMSVLILAAFSVSGIVFKVTTQGEVDEFNTQYDGAAEKIIDSFQNIMGRMGSVAGLGVSYTSAASSTATTSEWPFVGLDDFPLKANNALQLSGSLQVGMSPVVTGANFYPWDNYVLQPESYQWVTESIAYQDQLAYTGFESESRIEQTTVDADRVVKFMHYSVENGTVYRETPGQEQYLPMWQVSPYTKQGLVNDNLLRRDQTKMIVEHIEQSGHAVVGGFLTAPPGTTAHPDPVTSLLASLRSFQASHQTSYLGDPMANLYVPVFDSFDLVTRQVVGVMNGLIHWKSYFQGVLPKSIRGINVVLEYKCGSGGFVSSPLGAIREEDEEAQLNNGTTTNRRLSDILEVSDFQVLDVTIDYGSGSATPKNDPTAAPEISQVQIEQSKLPDNPNQEPQKEEKFVTDEMYESAPGESVFFTYVLNGLDAEVVGFGDKHDPTFDAWVRTGTTLDSVIDDGTVEGVAVDDECAYSISVYPTQSLYDEYITTTPIAITLVIALVFVFAIVLFCCYNHKVERRQQDILKKATQSTALVASLFPKHVQDQLLAGGDLPGIPSASDKKKLEYGTKTRLKGFMSGEDDENDATAAPIADLFPHCTVFFADIAGFTAWSSAREPSQVFILLQTLFQALDLLAKRRKVFKVETIGDCYMAVTGLPDPQPTHASIMIRFAYDCLAKMDEITKHLESSLGPDTTDLSIRVGMHSGPVTAGVLRGERARFQLFGDTVNTASRMESTGVRGKIQVSQATADIINEFGKGHWLTRREDAVKAKGKGVMVTYWANPKNKHGSSTNSGNSSRDDDDDSQVFANSPADTGLHQAHKRLVDWIVKLMLDDIKKIVDTRSVDSGGAKSKFLPKFSSSDTPRASPKYIPSDGVTCMDEVKDVIHMPQFDASKAHQTSDYKRIQVPDDIIGQLAEYVGAVSKLYRYNPFHNFEHACHVTMSVNKLIRRIVSPDSAADQMKTAAQSEKFAMHLHDYTYGINSDPLAMFAMTFSALIHDVDHQGISNMQLAEENPDLAKLYDQKSIAEQNSLDIAWDLLMGERFSKLRLYLFGTKEELLRFRQLIVNIVLATDIFDKELNDQRKNRWTRAFADAGAAVATDNNDENHSDLRATIVIEHIIQASDVSHTMQHWHVYQKWNRCLFREMHAAFKAGRLGKDPASFWYKGEMGFFDNYIIPLAKKLKDCGVFGVSSDEYLNYALQNRAEWEERGEEVVAGLIAECADAPEEPESRASARAAIRSSTHVDTDRKMAAKLAMLELTVSNHSAKNRNNLSKSAHQKKKMLELLADSPKSPKGTRRRRSSNGRTSTGKEVADAPKSPKETRRRSSNGRATTGKD